MATFAEICQRVEAALNTPEAIAAHQESLAKTPLADAIRTAHLMAVTLNRTPEHTGYVTAAFWFKRQLPALRESHPDEVADALRVFDEEWR